MNIYEIHVAPNALNQRFSFTLPLSSGNIPLLIELSYNRVGKYWNMSITNRATGGMLLSRAPILTGKYERLNLLSQLKHLGIGVCGVVKVNRDNAEDSPGRNTLGTDFKLTWGELDG